MLDERWDPMQGELADGLRLVLAKECAADDVRAAEAQGGLPALEAALAAFGLWELPDDPRLRTVAAWELGRALAPIDVDRLLPGGVTGDVAARLRWLLDAARLTGAAEGLLGLGVDYAKERQQFGRAIGSFQAVANRLVDAATAVDGAGLLVKKAAWIAGRADDLAPTWLFARMARWKAADAGRLTATNVHQVMGGYGFAMEYDCQLFSRRIRRWSARCGRPDDDLAVIGSAVADVDAHGELSWLWHHDEGLSLPAWAASP